MSELPSALPEVAVPVVAAVLYAAVWFATRALPGPARVSARVAPLVVIAGLLGLSLLLSTRGEQAGPAGSAGRTKGAAAPERAEVQPPHKGPATAPDPVAAQPGPPSTQIKTGAKSQPETPVKPPAKTPAKVATRNGDVASTATASAAANGDWDVVPVFYGTDRLRTDGPRRPAYGSERARRLDLGRALVTVPAAHRVPTIERPFALRVPYFQIVLYEQEEDPKKHFTIKELRPLSRDEFLALARERIAASRAFKDQALVFVHGFNTAFEHALYRTAQLAYDLKFDGAAFLYSWPSGGGLIGYGHDRESATQAEPYLKEFLDLVVRKSGATSVSLIAHSMGNLPLLNVLRELGPALPKGVRLNEVILAAPDVDRDVFANLAAGIRPYGRGITLYCSARDRAMSASRRFAGGVPRAGDVPPEGPVIIAGIDTIDVTSTSTDLLALNHSTYAEKSALLNDIGLLLQTGERPPERRIPILQKVKTARGEFWRYP
jgi:esterase/lipase superfamily enzyme